jgi:hypothetical protein
MKQIIKPLGGYETNYDICGGGGVYETKSEWNTMSMINQTTDIYNTIYFNLKKSSVCS